MLFQNPHTPPDLVNTARCNLVLALYKDNRHEEAEKVTKEETPITASVNSLPKTPEEGAEPKNSSASGDATTVENLDTASTGAASANMEALHRALLVASGSEMSAAARAETEAAAAAAGCNGVAASEAEPVPQPSVASTRPKKSSQQSQGRKRDRKKSSSSSQQQQQSNGAKSPQPSWMCTYCQVTLFQKLDFEVSYKTLSCACFVFNSFR